MTKAIALIALAALALSVASASASGSGRVVDLVVPKTKSTFDTDLGAKGYSPGDYFLVAAPVLDRVGGKRVGGLVGVWTIVSPQADDVSMTIHLQKGNVSLQGKIWHYRKQSQFRIVGGSGSYSGARGTATLRYLTETSVAVHIELS